MEQSLITEKTNARLIFESLDVSENTRKEYCTRITLFMDFVRENGFDRNSYLNFKRYLEARSEYTVATKNKYLATARVFLRELNRLGYLPVDITQNIRLFLQSKKHKKEGLTEREMKRIVAQIQKLPDSERSFRLRALFCLLALQGLRQIEIVRLDAKDVDLANGVAHIRLKGADDTEPVLLAPETISTLRKHMRVNKVGSGAVFRSLGNRKSERISTMTIKREFGRLFSSVGVEKTVHGFRHFYITKLLQNFDVRDVRKFSRHRSLEMLIVYDDELDIASKSEEVFSCFSELNTSKSI